MMTFARERGGEGREGEGKRECLCVFLPSLSWGLARVYDGERLKHEGETERRLTITVGLKDGWWRFVFRIRIVWFELFDEFKD